MPQFVASIAIFVVAYVAIASERFPRQAVALLGGVTLVVINVFDLKEAFGFVDWETMGLLFGMFILIEILKEAGFFGWLAATLARRLNYQPTAIFIAFPLMAGLLSGLMDSITVMLFLSALSVRLAKLIGIDPVPLIVAEVCAANTGGAATLVGDPPNVILGTLLGFNFNDFVLNTGPIALVALLITVGIFYAANRPMLKAAHASGSAPLFAMGLGHGIENMTMLRVGLVGFGVAIGLLGTHTTCRRISRSISARQPQRLCQPSSRSSSAASTPVNPSARSMLRAYSSSSACSSWSARLKKPMSSGCLPTGLAGLGWAIRRFSS
ncbi:MAG: anion permease [Anaerolineae bacterium]|nr:anion permease [Anaerolineae bacterium]